MPSFSTQRRQKWQDVRKDFFLEQEVTSLTVASAHVSFPSSTTSARKRSVLNIVNDVTFYTFHDTLVAKDIGIGSNASCWY